jgi:hypothetical protein
MRKTLVTLLIFLCTTLPAFAQHSLWSRTYGGSDDEVGLSVQQTADGGYIEAGWTSSFGASGWPVYLVKTNSIGDTLWSRTYGGDSWDVGVSAQQTADGGYIVAGVTYSFGADEGNIYLMRTDSAGETLWTRLYGGTEYEWGGSVQQTLDGGYIVTGETESFGAGGTDVYLIKTDSLGDTLWTRTYGGADQDCGYSVQQTTDGGYVVAGVTASFGAGSGDVYLVKTNSFGDTLWTRTYGGSEPDEGYHVEHTTDGGYVVVGWTGSFGAGNDDAYLIKTDSTGDTLWTRTYGGISYDYAHSVEQTPDNVYIVGGYTSCTDILTADAYVIKTDSTGEILWSRTYGGNDWDECRCIRQTTDGGFVAAGWTMSFGAGEIDLTLTRLDSLGNTCIGEFVSSTAQSVSSTVASPATIVTSPLTMVVVASPIVASVATEVTTVCVTNVKDETQDREKPLEFALSQNYPNPFNQTTKIKFTVAKSGFVSLNIYDLLGREVRALVSKHLSSGYKSVLWDGNDNSDNRVASGVYFCQMKMGDFSETKKLVLLK